MALDDNGRFRKKVRAFEALVTPEFIKRAREGKESIKTNPKAQLFRESIYQNWDSAYLLLHDLLLSTPIYRNYTFNRSIFTLTDLKRFASLSLKLKKFTDTHLGIIVRRDVTSKPVLQLKMVLDCVGLESWWASVRVVSGKKIYSYRLSRDALDLMKDILTVRRRARRREMDSLLDRQTFTAPSILRKRERAEKLKRISGSILV